MNNQYTKINITCGICVGVFGTIYILDCYPPINLNELLIRSFLFSAGISLLKSPINFTEGIKTGILSTTTISLMMLL